LRGALANEAIHTFFAAKWIASAFAKASADTSRSLSSGAHSRDPLARNDEKLGLLAAIAASNR